jgi:transposase-like protein
MFVSPKASLIDWAAVATYYDEGHTVRQCRERFRFSWRAWAAAVGRGDVVPRRQAGRPRGETRAAVEALISRGLSFAAIARELGVSKPTISYHARALGLPADSPSARRYDWSEVQRYYDEGHSITECQEHFGFSRASFAAAVKRRAVVTRPQAPPVTVYLVRGGLRHRGNIKRRLIRAGLKEDRCEQCGISEWQGRPLALALHHVNGDGRDNRLENLQLLCPNCHSQTENFAGRNVTRNGNGAAPAV